MVTSNAGLNIIRDFMAGDVVASPDWIGVGNDDTTPLNSDTSLNSELQRINCDTISKSDLQLTYDSQLASTEQIGQDLKEVGLFNANSGPTIFVHNTHATITKTNLIEVQYFITLKFEGD